MSDRHGPVNCVFVHGWAMNSAVWEECVAQLPEWLNVIMVDLPGHGTMADVHAELLDDYVQALMPVVHQPAIWVGWSLGGLAVLRLAELYPQRVASALLVATNPCFVSQPDWRCAVEADVFDQFAESLQKNQKKTIQRFLALQVKGMPDAIRTVRKLQRSLDERGQASAQALNSGLKVLQETDLRQTITLTECPLYWLLGGMDALVPVELAGVLKDEFAQENVEVYAKSGHAPFVSHQHEFVSRLTAIAEKFRFSQG